MLGAALELGVWFFVVIEHGAKVVPVHALGAHRAHEEAIVVALDFALGHRCFDALVQIGWKSVIRHEAENSLGCEFPSSYVAEITVNVLDMFWS